MVRLAGFEPATYGLEVRCSIQLSYRRTGEKLTSQVAYTNVSVHKKEAKGFGGYDLYLKNQGIRKFRNSI